MIPEIDLLIDDIEEEDYPNRTYRIDIFIDDEDCIQGYVDDMDAIIQAVYLMLNTERYEYPIYSWDYGVELVDLIGQPIPYVLSELERRITEALTQDDRIDSVTDFEFNTGRHKISVTFTIVTKIGEISSSLEVDI